MDDQFSIDNLQITNPPTRPAWKWQDLLLIILGIFFIFLGIIISINLIDTALEGDLTDTLQNPSIVQSLTLATLEVIALVVSIYFLGMRRRSVRWIDLGFIPFSTKWLMVVVGISILVIPLSGFITSLVLLLLKKPLENPQLPFLAPEGVTLAGAIGMLLLIGLAVPIAEELFFRGVLYNFLRARVGVWLAMITSSLIFAFAHGDLAVGTAAFVLGIVLAWTYERSESLWTSILIHAANNSVKLLVLYFLLVTKLIPS